MRRLLVTIDVECDKSVTWHVARPLSFRAVTETMPRRLQPLFDRWDIRPTWLLSPEVIADDDCAATLRGLERGELATHLHPEFIGPGATVDPAEGPRTSAMQADCPPAIERGKLAALTDLFAARFGRRPASFRAGRFGVGPHSGRFLSELGYAVDSSVTPHLTWTNPAGETRPDFRGCPQAPYRIDGGDLFTPGDGPLWEVPVTVLPPEAVPDARPMWPGGVSGEPVWFRPWYADGPTLRAIVRHVAESAPERPLVMMFHNVELLANASPYTRSEADVRRYLDLLETAFEAAREAGFEPITLGDYAAELTGGIGR